jgi:hypothetical protein
MYRTILLLLVMTSQALAFGVGLGGGASTREPVLIAASNAPDEIKASAAVVCTSTSSVGDDAPIINEALEKYGAVVLSRGVFNTKTPIKMHVPMAIYGSGIRTTLIVMRSHADSTNSCFELDNTLNPYPWEASTFLTIADMHISGGGTSYGNENVHGVLAKSDIQDFHFRNVFVSDFGGWGIKSVGSTWGWVFENLIVEYNEGGGIYHTVENKYVNGLLTEDVHYNEKFTQYHYSVSGTLTGTLSDSEGVTQGHRVYGTISGAAGLVDGETVTQAVSGATATVDGTYAEGAAVVILRSISGTFDETNTITGDTGGATIASPAIGPAAQAKVLEAATAGAVTLELWDVVGEFTTDDPIVTTAGDSVSPSSASQIVHATCYEFGSSSKVASSNISLTMNAISEPLSGGDPLVSDEGAILYIRSRLTGGRLVGTVTGTLEDGEYVTQATSGASGFVIGSHTGSSTVYLHGVNGTFSSSYTVTGKKSGATLPTPSVSTTTTPFSTPTYQGPKCSLLKVQQNEQHQWRIGYGIANTLIANSEIQATESGYAGILVEEAYGTVITGNRFSAAGSGSEGYIALGDPDDYSVVVVGLTVTGNHFYLDYDIPAVAARRYTAKHGGITVAGNTFDMIYSGAKSDPVPNWYYGLRIADGLETNSYLDRSLQYEISSQFRFKEFDPSNTADPLGYSSSTIVASQGRYKNHTVTNGIKTLPAALPGMWFELLVVEADDCGFDPSGTETLAITAGGAQQAAGKYVHASTVGNWIRLECFTAGEWECTGINGTWAVEP